MRGIREYVRNDGFLGHAGVAQLVEQLICNQQVAGSSPIASSSYGSLAMLEHRIAKG